MSTQIAVRLPDAMVEQVDQIVASGRAQSRTSVVETALVREIQRFGAERDAAILANVGPVDDLDDLVAWTMGNLAVDN